MMEQLKLPLKTERYLVGHCSCYHHPYYVGFGNYYEHRPWWKFWKPLLTKVKCPDCEDGWVYGYRVPIEPEAKLYNGNITYCDQDYINWLSGYYNRTYGTSYILGETR